MSSNNLSGKKIRKCPVSHQVTDQEDFEHDFTTQGKVGDLECPFVKMNGLPDTPNSHLDPIAAEFHADKSSVASATGLGQCPIRFLDKHSPEELAKYFENHKHEIPRSHEICVKRYQQNAHGIRQLDAKYGSLVNMIQGLGVKHKQYLPNSEVPMKQENSSTGVVEKWAETVSQKSVPMSDRSDAENEQERQSRVERPLREIRVGESPSRPWGISVPIDEIAASASQSEHGRARGVGIPKGVKHVASKVEPTTKEEAGNAARQAGDSPSQITEPRIQQPQIVFNGPVFFGYSAESAAKFLQALQLDGLPSRRN